MIQELLAAKKAEAELESRKKANMERQLAAHKSELDGKRREIEDGQGALQNLQEEVQNKHAAISAKEQELDAIRTDQVGFKWLERR